MQLYGKACLNMIIGSSFSNGKMFSLSSLVEQKLDYSDSVNNSSGQSSYVSSMVLGYRSFCGNLNSNEHHPIPPLKGKDTYMVAELDAAVGINAASKHIPEAKIFLSWLTTREFAQMVPDNLIGNFPVTKDTDITPANPYSNTFLELMAAAKGTDARFYMNAGTPGTSSLFVDLTVAVLNGTMTPQEAAKNLYDGISSWSKEQKSCKK